MISNFIGPVGAKRRAVEILVADLNFEEQQVRKKERREAFEKEKTLRYAARRAEINYNLLF